MTSKGWRAIKKMGSDIAVQSIKTVRKKEQLEGGGGGDVTHQ